MCCVCSLRRGTKALCSFFLTLLLLLLRVRETVKFPRKAHAAVNEEPILSLSSLPRVKVRERLFRFALLCVRYLYPMLVCVDESIIVLQQNADAAAVHGKVYVLRRG
jgi:hypothetical protein